MSKHDQVPAEGPLTKEEEVALLKARIQRYRAQIEGFEDDIWDCQFRILQLRLTKPREGVR